MLAVLEELVRVLDDASAEILDYIFKKKSRLTRIAVMVPLFPYLIGFGVVLLSLIVIGNLSAMLYYTWTGNVD